MERQLVYNDPRWRDTEWKFFACVVCDEWWPERMMQFQDGLASDRRCPNDFEPNGGSIARDIERAEASKLAGSIKARFAVPPKFPFDFDGFDQATALIEFDPKPLRLVRGGSPAELTINGTRLTSDDTITYDHAGLIDDEVPDLTQVTYDSDGSPESPYHDVLVLTVRASGAVPLGLHSLTYNDETYHNVFDVRAS